MIGNDFFYQAGMINMIDSRLPSIDCVLYLVVGRLDKLEFGVQMDYRD